MNNFSISTSMSYPSCRLKRPVLGVQKYTEPSKLGSWFPCTCWTHAQKTFTICSRRQWLTSNKLTLRSSAWSLRRNNALSQKWGKTGLTPSICTRFASTTRTNGRKKGTPISVWYTKCFNLEPPSIFHICKWRNQVKKLGKKTN